MSLHEKEEYLFYHLKVFVLISRVTPLRKSRYKQTKNEHNPVGMQSIKNNER